MFVLGGKQMIALSPEAEKYLKDRHRAVYLELPPAIDACCFQLTEAPSVKMGSPKDASEYVAHHIGEIDVFVPRSINHLELTLAISSFFGIKRIAVEGWKLV
jgi:hypothetical protein